MPPRSETLRICRDATTATLGFISMSDLSRKSGINEGTLSKISRGIIGLSDTNAHKLTEAVISRNYQEGWDYLEAAIKLADAFNYLRNHAAYLDERVVKQISDEDIERWYLLYIKSLEEAQVDFSETLEIIKISSDTKEILEYIVSFLKSWRMKHDFDYLDRIRYKFNQNKPIIIPGIKRGMEEDEYEYIKDIFTEIRHIAHLCEEFELVVDMCQWLLEYSKKLDDAVTYLKSQVTFAWTLTSKRDKKSLSRARMLVKEAWSSIQASNILENLSLQDIDVVSILCELRPRLETRIYEDKIHLLSIDNFECLILESKNLIQNLNNFELLEPRLQIRYKIPINYQRGIYLYLSEKYREARVEFEYVAYHAGLIGWIRVEQAAYSWLATLYYEMGERKLCSDILPKINAEYLLNRQLIREQIYLKMKA